MCFCCVCGKACKWFLTNLVDICNQQHENQENQLEIGQNAIVDGMKRRIVSYCIGVVCCCCYGYCFAFHSMTMNVERVMRYVALCMITVKACVQRDKNSVLYEEEPFPFFKASYNSQKQGKNIERKCAKHFLLSTASYNRQKKGINIKRKCAKSFRAGRWHCSIELLIIVQCMLDVYCKLCLLCFKNPPQHCS